MSEFKYPWGCKIHNDEMVVNVTPICIYFYNSTELRSCKLKTKLNNFSNLNKLGYKVYQKNYRWYVSFRGETYIYKDCLKLMR